MAKKGNINILASNAANDLVARFGHEAAYIFEPRYTTDVDNEKRQTNSFADFTPEQRAQVMQEAAIMLMAQFVALTGFTNDMDGLNKLTDAVVKKFLLYAEGYFIQFKNQKKEVVDGKNPS